MQGVPLALYVCNGHRLEKRRCLDFTSLWSICCLQSVGHLLTEAGGEGGGAEPFDSTYQEKKRGLSPAINRTAATGEREPVRKQ